MWVRRGSIFIFSKNILNNILNLGALPFSNTALVASSYKGLLVNSERIRAHTLKSWNWMPHVTAVKQWRLYRGTRGARPPLKFVWLAPTGPPVPRAFKRYEGRRKGGGPLYKLYGPLMPPTSLCVEPPLLWSSLMHSDRETAKEMITVLIRSRLIINRPTII